jgi:hypothetical protein
MVVLLVKAPDVPDMVTLIMPGVAAPLAENVNVLVVVALAGLKDAVTPVGNPEAERLTPLLKPFSEPIVSVLVPVAP